LNYRLYHPNNRSNDNWNNGINNSNFNYGINNNNYKKQTNK